MEDKLIAVIIGAIAGGVTGAVAALVAPWAKWGVKKREVQLKARQSAIKKARSLLSQDPFDLKAFLKSAPYSQLRSYFDEDLVIKIEGTPNKSDPGIVTDTVHIALGDGRHSGVNEFRAAIQDEIAKIEIDHNLI